MTKAGIAHLTKCLAVEWGKHGIRVNAVAPTFIRTPGTEEYLSDLRRLTDTIDRIAAIDRIGEPVEVAGAVVFLASSAASLITGETLLIDGGWTCGSQKFRPAWKLAPVTLLRRRFWRDSECDCGRQAVSIHTDTTGEVFAHHRT